MSLTLFLPSDKSVYPYFDIYSSGCPTKADLQEREILIRLPAAYPAIEICQFIIV